MALDLLRYLFYFIIGGLVVSTVVFFEESGYTFLSRIAMLFPILTWLSYLFIGDFGTPQQISEHATFVLLGTIVSWIPYMYSIIYFAPKLGVLKAIGVAFVVFLILASIFSYAYYKIKL